MTRTKKIFAVLLAALMMLAVLPVASFAASSVEAKKLAMLDDAWKPIEDVEKEMTAMKASAAETAAAAYKAALNNPLVDEGSLVWEGNEQFAFTVDGMHCVYCYRVRNTKHISSVTDDMLKDVVEYASKGSNCGVAGTANVLLVGPNYNESCTTPGYYDSSFTDQYMNEADSIASATGGTCTKLGGHNATGPNIASNYTNKGVVIYDSHGVQSGTSSYLCLTTNTGITSTDYNNGWAVSSGSEAFIDGRYIQNHVSGTLSNCFVWMAICEGMKKAGKGTTGTALLAAGAGGVYGYSQSVSFTGDYKYEKTFWTQMKNGATVKDAIATMKSTHGNWDPAYSSSSGAAWPIVMSAVDSFPSNPDGTQTVNCDWELFGTTEPDPITSVSLANINVKTGGTAQAVPTVNPSTADYTIQSYTSSNTAVATVNSNGLVTGVAAGTSTLTVRIKDNTNNAIKTATATITVEDFEGYTLVDTIEDGGKYIIVADESISGTSGKAVGNTAVSSNKYLAPTTVTINSDNTVTVTSANEPKVVWVASGNATSGYSFYNEAAGVYMALNSSEILCPATSGIIYWIYNSNQSLDNQVDSEQYYYLSYSDNSDSVGIERYTTSKQEAIIRLYKYVTANEPDPTAVPTATPTPVPTVAPTAVPNYTVNYVACGTAQGSQTAAYGSTVTLPATENVNPEGWTFAGWVANQVAETTNKPTYYAPGASYTVTGNATLYALYTRTEESGGETIYQQTNDLAVGGRYIIASGNYAAKNTTYNTTNNHYVSVQSITVSNGLAALASSVDPETVLWEIESGSASAGWVFRNNAVGGYFTLGSDEYLCVGTSPLAWTYDGADMNNQIDSEGYYYLALGSSNTYFTTSKNTNGTIVMYQEVSSAVTYYNTDPEVVAPTVYYTVTFKDWNGTVLSTQTVEQGAAATAPTVPGRTGYTFTGWDVDFSNVQSDLIVTAQYTVNSYTLTINYLNEDDEVIAPAYVGTVAYGQSYSVTSPVIEGYTTDQLVVSGTMPAANYSVNVYYVADEPVIEALPGDVDCNGVVDMSDVSMLFSYLNGGGEGISAQGLVNADVNNDGMISVMDISGVYGIIANS